MHIVNKVSNIFSFQAHFALSDKRIVMENSLTTKKVPREGFMIHAKLRIVTFGSIIPRVSIKFKTSRACNENDHSRIYIVINFRNNMTKKKRKEPGEIKSDPKFPNKTKNNITSIYPALSLASFYRSQ